MKDKDFKTKLRDIADHIFNYGLRRLRREEESLGETCYRVGTERMRREDFKGFSYAQEQILKSILFIEDELITIRNEKKKIRKGKHKKELQQHPNYIRLNEEEQYLIMQEAAFREIANSIAWILFGSTRGHLRRLINPDSRHGYLRDKNWDSAMRIVREMNKKEDTFALLSDITSVIGIGDILAWTPEGTRIIEVKEGKVAQQVIQKVPQSEHFIKLDKSNNGRNEKPYKDIIKHNRYLIKQTARQKRQIERMGRFEKIRLTDQGIDPIIGQQIRIVELGHEEERINSIIGHLIENPPEEVLTNSVPLLLSTDCYLIGITGLPNVSEFVRRANFQHAIYHLEQTPWKRCDFISSPETRDDRDLDKLEPQVYLVTHVENLKDSIFIPTHCPLYLLIRVDATMKLIFGEISVFIKFYPEKFRNICETLGIETRWVGDSQLSRHIASTNLKKTNFAKFSNGYLGLKFENNKSFLSTSMFYSMIYELETGRSVALKLFAKNLR